MALQRRRHTILGRKHPSALGRPSMDVWAEAREVLEPMFARVFMGEPVSIEDFALGLDRQGRIEEAHFEFAYTPARGEDGSVQGLFGACIETTARIMAERRQIAAMERQRRQFQVRRASSRSWAVRSTSLSSLTKPTFAWLAHANILASRFGKWCPKWKAKVILNYLTASL